ncbi:MAG: hypothetical protein EXR08_09720 [Alphaproteobacteria bacterium]|nr:hypothetical protein [Alphaproteobacteria bacterium]
MTYSTKTIIAAALALGAVMAASYLMTFMPAKAQVQGPVAASAGECVTYGSGSALQMCLHKFSDGTRCVAAGGGGLASAGAGAALQCTFR